ncbi:MAG: class III poly(R)-hydroxyalkanoic acid synthase subunit PhaE [Chromatiales bacterium]|nr:class III poly(R)-hydroxyalkanoic acid synthase subunit PhaE [Chromatiales bacterium]
MAANAFGNEWLDLQRRYWGLMQEMGSAALGDAGKPAAAPANPWLDMFEQWRRAAMPQSGVAGDLFGRVVDQGKVFDNLARVCNEGFQTAMNSGEQAQAAWSKAIEKGFEQLREGVGQTGGLDRVFSFWTAPVAEWQKQMPAMPAITDLFMQPGSGPWSQMTADGWYANTARWLNTPGLGLSRERQGQWQRAVTLYMDYQRAFLEFTALFKDFASETAQRLQTRMTEEAVAQPDGPWSTARGLYGLWVDAAEAVYAEIVTTDAYQAANGRMIDAQMSFKREMNQLVDASLHQLHLPTRADFDSLAQRVQSLKRENRALIQRIEALEGQSRDEPKAEKRPAKKKSAGGKSKKSKS